MADELGGPCDDARIDRLSSASAPPLSDSDSGGVGAAGVGDGVRSHNGDAFDIVLFASADTVCTHFCACV